MNWIDLVQRRWEDNEDNIKMDLKEQGRCMNWIDLVQRRWEDNIMMDLKEVGQLHELD